MNSRNWTEERERITVSSRELSTLRSPLKKSYDKWNHVAWHTYPSKDNLFKFSTSKTRDGSMFFSCKVIWHLSFLSQVKLSRAKVWMVWDSCHIHQRSGQWCNFHSEGERAQRIFYVANFFEYPTSSKIAIVELSEVKFFHNLLVE